MTTSRRRKHVKAILELQKEHRVLGMKDPKGVSMLSKSLSKTDRKLAILFGTVDRTEVIRIWKAKSGGTQEAVQSQYYQLSVTMIIGQSTKSTILLSEGTGYSPRLGQRTRKCHTEKNEKKTSTSCNVSKSIEVSMLSKSKVELKTIRSTAA